MKRLICALFLTLSLVSCGGREPDYLAYQRGGLEVVAEFTLDGESFTASLTLEPPELDESGRMLAREGTLALESALLDGVRFEFSSEGVNIVAGAMKIPLQNDRQLAGLRELLSLFCIEDASYHSAEELENGCTLVRFSENEDSESRVTVTLDENLIPHRIEASSDGRILAADITEMKIF